ADATTTVTKMNKELITEKAELRRALFQSQNLTVDLSNKIGRIQGLLIVLDERETLLKDKKMFDSPDRNAARLEEIRNLRRLLLGILRPAAKEYEKPHDSGRVSIFDKPETAESSRDTEQG